MTIEESVIKKAAEKASAELSAEYWDGSYPVDPFIIAQALDIQVHRIELPANTAGGIWSKKDYPPVIFINRDDHPNRQRFTCAHELGHYYLRQGDDEFEFTDFRNNLSSEGSNEVEVFANNFAASLLMPKDEVTRQHAEGRSIIALAKYFGVSPEAVGYRLENLGIGRTLSTQ